MKHLIKAEIYRLCCGNFLFLFITVSGLFSVFSIMNIIEHLQLSAGLLDVHEVSVITGYSERFVSDYAGAFSFFIPFLVIILFGNDFIHGQVGQLLGHGFERKAIFAAKYISFCGVVVVLFSTVSSLGTIAATLINGWGVPFTPIQLLNLLVMTLNIALVNISLATPTILLSLKIKREAVVVILFFVLNLVESIIAALLAQVGKSSSIIYAIAKIFPSNFAYEIETISINADAIPFAIASIGLSVLFCIFFGIRICNKSEI